MNFINILDTNSWLYVHDSRDPLKQSIARQLVASVRPLLLPWQVGCEFVAASRKLSAVGFSEALAWAALSTMQKLADRVILPTTDYWADAQSLQSRYSLSFWYAILIAACIRDGAATLYTEDIGAPRTIDQLSLVNPFLATPITQQP